jgi:hypothetical protein
VGLRWRRRHWRSGAAHGDGGLLGSLASVRAKLTACVPLTPPCSRHQVLSMPPSVSSCASMAAACMLPAIITAYMLPASTATVMVAASGGLDWKGEEEMGTGLRMLLDSDCGSDRGSVGLGTKTTEFCTSVPGVCWRQPNLTGYIAHYVLPVG